MPSVGPVGCLPQEGGGGRGGHPVLPLPGAPAAFGEDFGEDEVDLEAHQGQEDVDRGPVRARGPLRVGRSVIGGDVQSRKLIEARCGGSAGRASRATSRSSADPTSGSEAPAGTSPTSLHDLLRGANLHPMTATII